ncbi:uncharacterized protein EV420DRAFT_1693595 [Desarmillaria tabescens]|uniref:Uncharacterized protein n=1 Tax=Armillaria tabescens TaxID=1929756 RepID=A0AA39K6L8_ARMTA|nr:uncharacterized protein EV420DRAFT_1693595 [Desarmillaria tabescens]KAK0455534.1 hypothetical protein EV420DRAFT_1693595 [Desarmillaria tabescens]
MDAGRRAWGDTACVVVTQGTKESRKSQSPPHREESSRSRRHSACEVDRRHATLSHVSINEVLQRKTAEPFNSFWPLPLQLVSSRSRNEYLSVVSFGSGTLRKTSMLLGLLYEKVREISLIFYSSKKTQSSGAGQQASQFSAFRAAKQLLPPMKENGKESGIGQVCSGPVQISGTDIDLSTMHVATSAVRLRILIFVVQPKIVHLGALALALSTSSRLIGYNSDISGDDNWSCFSG